MQYKHGARLFVAASIIMTYASYVEASGTNLSSPTLHDYTKRELSDSTYNRLAIIHASGRLTFHAGDQIAVHG